jgi:hypothetical protein
VARCYVLSIDALTKHRGALKTLKKNRPLTYMCRARPNPKSRLAARSARGRTRAGGELSPHPAPHGPSEQLERGGGGHRATWFGGRWRASQGALEA